MDLGLNISIHITKKKKMFKKIKLLGQVTTYNREMWETTL